MDSICESRRKASGPTLSSGFFMPFLNWIRGPLVMIRAANHHTRSFSLACIPIWSMYLKQFRLADRLTSLKSSAGVRYRDGIREALQGGTFVTSPSKKSHWQPKSNATTFSGVLAQPIPTARGVLQMIADDGVTKENRGCPTDGSPSKAVAAYRASRLCTVPAMSPCVHHSGIVADPSAQGHAVISQCPLPPRGAPRIFAN